MFPPEFVQQLLEISNPSDSTDPSNASKHAESDNRATKRTKIAHGATSSMLVAIEEMEVVRPIIGDLSMPPSTHVPDIDTQLRFNVTTKKGAGIELRISTEKNSSPINLQASVVLPISESARKIGIILAVGGRNRAKSDQPSMLWASVDLTVRCVGPKICLKFCFKLHWNETPTPYQNIRTTHERQHSQLVLDTFPLLNSTDEVVSSANDRRTWSPIEFYNAAYVPPKQDEESHSIELPDLVTPLYPYQKRSLQWLLNREGVRWSKPTSDSPGLLEDIKDSCNTALPESFREVIDLAGTKWYVSHLFQIVTTDVTPFAKADSLVKGGILAEEMGLGKTLETIGLILLHKRESIPETAIDVYSKRTIKPSGTTLIVTPEPLRRQWLSELKRHAPYLRVRTYLGLKSTRLPEAEIVEDFLQHDVIVTTYSVLTSEIHFAIEPPERSMRQERKYTRPTSPLVQVEWWRICLDEAQMIESGVTHAATVARVLSRVNSWGITGTPVKSEVKDLLGLLLFLRYEPYCSCHQIWQSLVNNHRTLFQKLFRRISLRHTKQLVGDELKIPPQKRYVVSIPFTAVEEQHYQSLYQQMATELGLTTKGAPLDDGPDLENRDEAMSTWLNRLRQTALHPEVGALNRQALGRKAGPLRTMEEVLNTMIEQSDTSVKSNQRAYYSSKLKRGQLLENGPLVKNALSIWDAVRAEISTFVLAAREELEIAIKNAKDIEFENASDTETDSEDKEIEDETDE
jgi:E3 ubiquitin-protein ligase SHPRH